MSIEAGIQGIIIKFFWYYLNIFINCYYNLRWRSSYQVDRRENPGYHNLFIILVSKYLDPHKSGIMQNFQHEILSGGGIANDMGYK